MQQLRKLLKLIVNDDASDHACNYVGVNDDANDDAINYIGVSDYANNYVGGSDDTSNR